MYDTRPGVGVMEISVDIVFLAGETEGLLAAEQRAAWRNMSAAFGE